MNISTIMFDIEFKTLTDVGNNHSIRYYEGKMDISDNLYYENFYKRCLSLISILLNVI